MSKRIEDLSDKELEYWRGKARDKAYLEKQRRDREQRRVYAMLEIREAFGDTVPDQEINHNKEH